MKVKLISLTKPEVEGLDAPEDIVAYCARVSNPSNQMNTETAPRLIKYLIKHKHWSPFELASMCVEITTSRAIAAQILRHRRLQLSRVQPKIQSSYRLRRNRAKRFPAEKNRQSSSDALSQDHKAYEYAKVSMESSLATYETLIQMGSLKKPREEYYL